MANIKKVINENGIVLAKVFIEAKKEWESRDGRKFDAQPEKFIVTVASGENISPDTGIDNCLVQDYQVTREEFQKFKYLQVVNVEYEFSTYGTKPMTVTILK